MCDLSPDQIGHFLGTGPHRDPHSHFIQFTGVRYTCQWPVQRIDPNVINPNFLDLQILLLESASQERLTELRFLKRVWPRYADFAFADPAVFISNAELQHLRFWFTFEASNPHLVLGHFLNRQMSEVGNAVSH